MYHHYYNLYFTTATIVEWRYLLKRHEFKEIIIDSMRFLVQENRAVIYDFVIMPNHIHLIWYIPEPYTLSEVHGALLSYTAHAFKKLLKSRYPSVLPRFKVDLKDRDYQFWKRNPLSIAIFHNAVFIQKAAYIHWNPCTDRWKLAEKPEAYKYSSAYESENGAYWDFVTVFG